MVSSHVQGLRREILGLEGAPADIEMMALELDERARRAISFLSVHLCACFGCLTAIATNRFDRFQQNCAHNVLDRNPWWSTLTVKIASTVLKSATILNFWRTACLERLITFENQSHPAKSDKQQHNFGIFVLHLQHQNGSRSANCNIHNTNERSNY